MLSKYTFTSLALLLVAPTSLTSCSSDSTDPTAPSQDSVAYSVSMTCDDVGNTGKTISDSVSLNYMDACIYNATSKKLSFRLYNGTADKRVDSGMVEILLSQMNGPGVYETDGTEEGISVTLNGASEKCEGNSWTGSGCSPVAKLCKISVIDTDVHKLSVTEGGQRKDGKVTLEMSCGHLTDWCTADAAHQLTLSDATLKLQTSTCLVGL